MGKGCYVSESSSKTMDKELIILEQIQKNPHINQRNLASVAKVSLGMTNVILKRFVKKGMITIKKVNNRNVLYALTAEGLDSINRRSWFYFKRTIKNVVNYQDAIREVVKQAKANGYEGIVLVGESDLAFIVEYTCLKEHIELEHRNDKVDIIMDGWFYLIAESERNDIQFNKNIFLLNRLIY